MNHELILYKINKYQNKLKNLEKMNGGGNCKAVNKNDIEKIYVEKINNYVDHLKKFEQNGGFFFNKNPLPSVLEKLEQYDYGTTKLNALVKKINEQDEKITKIIDYAKQHFTGNKLRGIVIPSDNAEIKNHVESKIKIFDDKVNEVNKNIELLLNNLLKSIEGRSNVIPYKHKTEYKVLQGGATIKEIIDIAKKSQQTFNPKAPKREIINKIEEVKK